MGAKKLKPWAPPHRPSPVSRAVPGQRRCRRCSAGRRRGSRRAESCEHLSQVPAVHDHWQLGQALHLRSQLIDEAIGVDWLVERDVDVDVGEIFLRSRISRREQFSARAISRTPRPSANRRLISAYRSTVNFLRAMDLSRSCLRTTVQGRENRIAARRRWAESVEIGWVHSQEIRWVQSQEIGWAQSEAPRSKT
jgi:hypothetical protein